MRIACVIPTYNFLQGVKRISHLITNEYHFLCSDYKVVVVDDNSDLSNSKDFDRISKLENFEIVKSNGERSLKEAILTGYDQVKDWNPDVINIIETDALPQTSTLQAMIRTYLEAGDKVGSVSPMYKWKNEYCYPTHKDWLVEPKAKEKFSSGDVREVGACGVPFLFSIWRPKLFDLMLDRNLPHLRSLDSEFGLKVHRAGYRHLRVVDSSVEHWGGGMQSGAIRISK